MVYEDLTAVKARFFKALGDRTRLGILEALKSRGSMSVGEICEATGAEQSTVSHHLACLRTCGLVRARKEGKQVIYSINGDFVRKILELSEDHVRGLAEQILSCKIVERE
jgi:DNA-binding transcriptional ArsR family regulator